MTDATGAAQDAGKDDSGNADAKSSSDYTSRVLGVSKWALGALAAAATAALGKLGFDRLGDGDYSHWRWLLTFVSAGVFSIGIVALVGAYTRATVQTRVPFNWLLLAKDPNERPWLRKPWRFLHRLLGRDPYLAWEIRHTLEQSAFLLPGAFSTDEAGDANKADGALKRFDTAMSELMAAQFADPEAFLTDDAQVDRLLLMQQAHENLFVEAGRIRTQALGQRLPLIFLIAALLATTGGVGFAFATGQAKRAASQLDHKRDRAEKLADETNTRNDKFADTTTPLVPRAPSPVQVLPSAGLKHAASQLNRDRKKPCDLSKVTGFVVQVATPPQPQPRVNVMNVLTTPTDRCRSASLWLPPSSVLPMAPATGSG